MVPAVRLPIILPFQRDADPLPEDEQPDVAYLRPRTFKPTLTPTYPSSYLITRTVMTLIIHLLVIIGYSFLSQGLVILNIIITFLHPCLPRLRLAPENANTYEEMHEDTDTKCNDIKFKSMIDSLIEKGQWSTALVP